MSNRHLRWDSDRFFWAILTLELPDRADIHSPSIRSSLDAAFEPHVPVPIDELATAYLVLGDGRILACGIPEASVLQDATGAITLSPSRLPEWVGDEAKLAPATSMNVLTGAYTPERVRAAKRRQQFVVATALTLVAGLVCYGLERRIMATERALGIARATVEDLEQSAVVATLPATRLPLRQRIFTELNRLRATRDQAAKSGVSDVSLLMEPVLRRWPAEAKARATDLSATGTSLTMSAIVNSPAEAEKLVATYAQMPGWQAPRSEITATPGGTAQRVRLTMTVAARPEAPAQ